MDFLRRLFFLLCLLFLSSFFLLGSAAQAQGLSLDCVTLSGPATVPEGSSFVPATASYDPSTCGSLFAGIGGVGLDDYVEVDYVITGGLATAGSDFDDSNPSIDGLSGTIQIAGPAFNSTTFGPTIIQDSLVEPDEDYFVEISNATLCFYDVYGFENCESVGIVNDSVQTFIVDDDDAPIVEITTATTTLSVTEGNNTVVNVEINSPIGASTDCVVDVASSPLTATETGANADYSPISSTVVVTSAGLSVPVSASTDALLEGPETFEIILREPLGADVSGNPACEVGANDTATITIIDVPPSTTLVAEFTHSPIDFTVNEGGMASVDVTIVSPSGATGVCDIDLDTISGTATASTPADFTAQSVTLTVSSSPTTVTIPIASDLLTEGNESFRVVLSETSSGGGFKRPAKSGLFNLSRMSNNPACEVGANDTAIITIIDVPPPPPPPVAEFTPATTSVTVDEGDDAIVEVFISALPGNAGVCEIDIATSTTGSATDMAPDADFTPQSTTLTVSASPATPLTIPTATDLLTEGSETFTIDLFTTEEPTPGVPACDIGSNNSATVTITDDPPPPPASLVAEFTHTH